jgi:dihydroorotase
MHFDLLIKGGEVVDPAGDRHGQLDVAVKAGRIALVDREIPADAALEVIDASGRYVTPGLIDLHTHVYRGVTFWGVNADAIAWRTGVSTWLDVGSAGAFTLPGFYEYVVKPAAVRVFALLNISSIGLVAETYELSNLAYCDVDLCTSLASRYPELVRGIKARIDRMTVGENGLEPLRRARRAADECELPLMVHIGYGPPKIEDVLELMRPGDVLTHCSTGLSMRLVDASGRVLEAARRAQDSGIVMDVGHGSGSFSFETAEAMFEAGFKPDVISSDIHQMSVHGPMFDLPTCLSKFLSLGMSFSEVIEAATSRPAEILGLTPELGSLKPGSRADLALFTVERGRFPLYDVHLNRREGTEMIRNTLTIVNGRPLPARLPEPPAPWIELTEKQREFDAALRQPPSPTPAVYLKDPECFGEAMPTEWTEEVRPRARPGKR